MRLVSQWSLAGRSAGKNSASSTRAYLGQPSEAGLSTLIYASGRAGEAAFCIQRAATRLWRLDRGGGGAGPLATLVKLPIAAEQES